MSDEDVPFFYANVVTITTGPFDMVVDFGFVGPENVAADGVTPQRRVRIAMSPSSAKSILRILAEQIQSYEEKFGEIPSPHWEKGGDPHDQH